MENISNNYIGDIDQERRGPQSGKGICQYVPLKQWLLRLATEVR